jgi:hypothetical protein
LGSFFFESVSARGSIRNCDDLHSLIDPQSKWPSYRGRKPEWGHCDRYQDPLGSDLNCLCGRARYTDFAEVVSKETADFYARVQMGEAIVMGVNPLLLNAEKAETLRRRRKQ